MNDASPEAVPQSGARGIKKAPGKGGLGSLIHTGTSKARGEYRRNGSKIVRIVISYVHWQRMLANMQSERRMVEREEMIFNSNYQSMTTTSDADVT